MPELTRVLDLQGPPARPDRPARDPHPERSPASSEPKGLLCAACGAHITDRRHGREVQGSHQHRFMNPGGFLYHVGCFAEAIGCVIVGPDSPEYPWFVGYLWSCAHCSGCGTQLGWRFRSGQGEATPFYGLILDRLRDVEGGSPS